MVVVRPFFDVLPPWENEGDSEHALHAFWVFGLASWVAAFIGFSVAVRTIIKKRLAVNDNLCVQ